MPFHGLGLELPYAALLGGSAGTPFDILNPLDSSAGLVLSNTYRTVTCTSAAAVEPQARSVTGRSTGKVHLEFTIAHQGTAGAENMAFGIATAAHPYGPTWLGRDTLSIGLWADGAVFINSVAVLAANAAMKSLADGTVFAVEYDHDAKKMWVKNVTRGTNWNNSGTANPATGVGGIDCSTFAGGRSFVTCGFEVVGDAVTVNTGNAPYALTPSLGFGNWYNPSVSKMAVMLICDGGGFIQGQAGNGGWPAFLPSLLSVYPNKVSNTGHADTSADQISRLTTAIAPLVARPSYPLQPTIVYATSFCNDDHQPITVSQWLANCQTVVSWVRAAGVNYIVTCAEPYYAALDPTFTLLNANHAQTNAGLIALTGVDRLASLIGTPLEDISNITNPTYFIQPGGDPTTFSYQTIFAPAVATAINALGIS